MAQIRISRLLAVLMLAVNASVQVATAASTPPAARVVDLKAFDGTVLKANYFAAAEPGPGVLLFHQSNRTRKAWDDVARRLAASGIHTLTLDLRGFGESGGKPYDKLSDKEIGEARDLWPR